MEQRPTVCLKHLKSKAAHSMSEMPALYKPATRPGCILSLVYCVLNKSIP